MEKMEADPVVDHKFPFDLWRKFKSMFTFIMDEEADSLDEHAKIMREVLSKMGEQEGVFSPFLTTKNNTYCIDYYKGLFKIIYYIIHFLLIFILLVFKSENALIFLKI